MAIDFTQAAQNAAVKLTSSPSALVQQEVFRIKMILQPESSCDVTGPAATVIRRIDGRLKEVLVIIKRLEFQLKIGKNQRLLIEQLGETIDQFFYTIAMDWFDLKLQMNQSVGSLERLQQKLPEWFQKLIYLTQKRKGVPITGGGLRPFNLSDPHFKGEAVPHPLYALPKKQREDLRPGGLEWIYSFRPDGVKWIYNF